MGGGTEKENRFDNGDIQPGIGLQLQYGLWKLISSKHER